MWAILVAALASAITFAFVRRYVKTSRWLFLGLAVGAQFVLIKMYGLLLRGRSAPSSLFGLIKMTALLLVAGYGVWAGEAVTWPRALGFSFAVAALYLLG